MEHEKWIKSHGILLSVMKIYQICLRIVPNLFDFCRHSEMKHQCRQSAFSNVFHKKPQMHNHEKVIEKYFVKSMGTLSKDIVFNCQA